MSGNKEHVKKFYKTRRGLLQRIFYSQKRTAEKRSHVTIYYSRKAFEKFGMGSRLNHSLFNAWEDSGYNKDRKPSCDRIDPNKGYSMGNIQWMTHHDNQVKGIEEHIKKLSIPICQRTLSGEFIRIWSSSREATRCTGVANGSISCCINGKFKTAGGFTWTRSLCKSKVQL